MNADSFYIRRLRRLKWVILGLTALLLAGVEAYYFARGVPLVENLVDWLIGMVIAVVLLEITFRIVANLQSRLQHEIAERRRAEEALQQRNRDLELLNRSSRTFNSTLDLDQVLATVLEETRHLMNVVASSIWLLDPETEELVCLQSTGLHSDVVRGWRLTPGEGLAGWVARHGESLVVPDAQADERHSEKVDLLTGMPMHSVLTVPLRTKQGVIGVIQVLDTEIDRFESTDLALLEALASAAAIAIDNARLYEQAQQEIAERKRTEKALRESEEKYRDLVENTNDVIYAVDKDGVVTYVNPAVEAFIGYSPSEIIGHHFREFIYPEDLSRLRESFQHIFSGRTTANEYRVLTKSGETRWMRSSSRPTFAGDCVIGVQGVLTDITEHKRAEERLRFQAQLLDSVRESVVATDLEGHVIYWGKGAEALYGYAAEEIMGKPITFIVEPNGKKEEEERVWQVRETGSWSGQYVQKRKDGTKFWADTFISLVTDENGRPCGLVGIDRDITERRRAEEEKDKLQAQFLQAQKMEAVGRLAGGVAHDFNNLLTTIMGYADLTLISLPEESPSRDDLTQIIKAADRGASLVRQLLAFSRRQILQLKVLDLNAVIANLEEMLRRLIGEDVELVTIFDPTLEHVRADPGQIEQVIMNLAVNARDAMPGGGRLTLETMNVVLDETYVQAYPEVKPGPYVMLAVNDTGIGMDDEVKSHLFEPFFTTKEVGKGTGLGLATVYGIVKQSEGHIEVHSEPGLGTTLKIYLPMVGEETEPIGPEPTASDLPSGTETILLVEDEEMVKELARQILEQQGYTILAARQPSEALLLCERHTGPIHLLVTDVVMPEMGGQELERCLASLRPGMKVLYISGYADDTLAQRGVLGPDKVLLQKPFTTAALVHKVREVLDAPL